MKLTPLDIRKQEFGRRVRGVDEEEVKAFLQMIASQWEEVQDEQRRLEEKVRDLDNKLEHYKRVEEALQEALRTARENAKDALDTARQKAQIIVQEAEANATHIKRDADDDRRKMKRQIARLSHRRDELVSRLRAFLMSEMEMLARFEGDDAVGYIKLMPAEERAPEIADIAEEAEPEPIPLPEESPVPEAPLPTWARFEDDEEPELDPPQTAPSPVESLSDQQGDTHAESPTEPQAQPRQEEEEVDVPSAEFSADAATQDAEAAPISEERAPQAPIEAPAAYSNGMSDTAHAHPQAAAASEGLPDEPPPVVASAPSEVHDEPVASSEPEAVHPDASEDEQGPGVSRWLSDHLFSAFKKGGQEPGDSGDRAQGREAPVPQGVDAYTDSEPARKGWMRESGPKDEARNGAHQPAVEEEEESFTVSSEEVERIRRILKGLD